MPEVKRVRFEAIIRAPAAKAWETMLGPDTYMHWTAPFMEGCYYEGSWDQGSRIRFLGPSL